MLSKCACASIVVVVGSLPLAKNAPSEQRSRHIWQISPPPSHVSGSSMGDGGDIESSDLGEQPINASRVKYLVEVQLVDPHLCGGDHHDTTPLHWASHWGHLDIVRYLVEERN